MDSVRGLHHHTVHQHSVLTSGRRVYTEKDNEKVVSNASRARTRTRVMKRRAGVTMSGAEQSLRFYASTHLRFPASRNIFLLSDGNQTLREVAHPAGGSARGRELGPGLVREQRSLRGLQAAAPPPPAPATPSRLSSLGTCLGAELCVPERRRPDGFVISQLTLPVRTRDT